MGPVFTIFTPLHAAGNRYIREAYESLKAQTFLSWEWVVLVNNGGQLPGEIAIDPKISVHMHNDSANIGALKNYAASLGNGAYIVELDADDRLSPNCLEVLLKNFAKADFLCSNFAEFEEGDLPVVPYRADYGWEHYGWNRLNAMRAPDICAQNLRRIEWAPNHVRAWRRDVYQELGGHNVDLEIGDDHELSIRFYLAGKRMKRIKQCLYFYRVHPENTVKKKNSAIQIASERNYNKYVWALAEQWCERKGLLKIDLCGGHDSPPGYIAVDKVPSYDLVMKGMSKDTMTCDLDREWSLAQNSVGLLRAQDALEHLKSPIHVMNEAYRVLAPGGFFMIQVPSTSGKGAHMDPTHVSFWNDLSFGYYTNRDFAKYIPEFKGRFAVSRVQEWFPTPWHQANNVPYVEAHLIALKEGYHHYGEVKI